MIIYHQPTHSGFFLVFCAHSVSDCSAHWSVSIATLCSKTAFLVGRKCEFPSAVTHCMTGVALGSQIIVASSQEGTKEGGCTPFFGVEYKVHIQSSGAFGYVRLRCQVLQVTPMRKYAKGRETQWENENTLTWLIIKNTNSIIIRRRRRIYRVFFC